MINLYTIFVILAVCAEVFNALWLYKNGALKAVNTVPTIIFIIIGMLCFLPLVQDFFLWVFFVGLLIWHGMGFFLQRNGNPFNHNQIASVLLGMYIAVTLFFMVLRYPCSNPKCEFHHPTCTVEEMQSIFR